MNGLQALIQRLGMSWRSFGFNQKIIVGTVLGASVLSLVVFSVWIQSEEMAVLFSGLTPEDSGEILEEVGKLGVEAEVSGGGGTILVPSTEVLRLRVELASRGLPSHGSVGFELFDEKRYGMTDFLQNVNYQRALEGELGRSIASIRGVEHARVHITFPKRSLFVRQSSAGTASVLLTLRRRVQPTRDQIAGIQNLVASAVEGMESARVMVLDESGSLLSGGTGDAALDLTSGQLSMRKQVEDYLAGKASDLLLAVLGPGRSVVRVNADIDFDRVETVKESYDPSSVIVSEQRDESSDPATGGTTESSITNYDPPKTVQTILDAGGGVQKLTVSVFVDGAYQTGDDATAGPTYVPRTDEELADIQRVVASAIGLDTTRGDEIQVVNMQFRVEEVVEPSFLEAPLVRNLPDLIGRVLLFVIAAVLILSLRRSLGQLAREASAPMPTGRGSSGAAAAGPERDPAASSMEDWTRASPDEVADLIKAFASQDQ